MSSSSNMTSQPRNLQDGPSRLPQLADIEPCIFPAFDVGENEQGEFLSFGFKISPALPPAVGAGAEGVVDRDSAEMCKILRSAWGVLLGCYTGLEDVCFGLEHAAAFRGINGAQNERDASGQGSADIASSSNNNNNDTNNTNNSDKAISNGHGNANGSANGTTSKDGAHAVMQIAQLHIPGDKRVQALLAESNSTGIMSHPNSGGRTLFNTLLRICSTSSRGSTSTFSTSNNNNGTRSSSFPNTTATTTSYATSTTTTTTSSSSSLSISNSPNSSNGDDEHVVQQLSAPQGVEVDAVEVDASWCRVRITVDPETLETVLSWMGSFMTREQALNVGSTYEKIVNEMLLAGAETTILELDCFSERNLEQVLQWNGNLKSNVQQCIHQAIEKQGALRPEAEAVCAWDGSFTYAELLRLSDRLAKRLVSSGVGPEVFVPICLDKSRWTMVAMLGVLKAGGVFVPLDPTHPVPRLQALAHKVGARTLLCSRCHRGMLETVAAELIPVDGQLFAELPEHDGAVMDRGVPSNGAYMIFTSGTTGEPKGALIEHGSLMSSAHAHGPAMLMDSNTRSLQFAASTFDVSITEILTCLILGGCVCVPSEEARLNDIERAITELRANWALLTPTFVKFINPADVPTLKTLVTGGEAMTQAIIRAWSHINLINCYGPAETSVVSHVHPFMREGKNPLNIGHQVGIHCWVVDRYNHDRLMPVGAVGELVIEGHTLAREYYKEPEKTGDAFITDPLWARTRARTKAKDHDPDRAEEEEAAPRGRRMYKTGDLVKYNSDGTFHIAGRKDTQIKFHGQRIELGEIEHHLNVSPSIMHGMVMLPKEGFCKGRLLTMVQLRDPLGQDLVPNGRPYHLVEGELAETAAAAVAEVKEFLTQRLPPYMVPSMWLTVEFIPRLQSGKLDRKQTARWVDTMSEALYRQLNPVVGHHNGGAADGEAGAPEQDLTFASETELELRRVWAHVLNLHLEQLGLRQSFLSVGGDSISAMQVMGECRKRGLGLTVRSIIGCKSITELATHVKPIETPLFHKEVVEQPFGLSPIQRLYFARANHSRGHYNQSFLLKTSRRILPSDLRAALETVVTRHSMLRARFSQGPDGEWQQRVTGEVAGSFRLRALKVASSDQVDPVIAESQTCLSATEGPLFAADLIGVEDGDEELLFVVAHHLVIDLVSWRVILQDIEELLTRPDEAANAERPLPFQTWCKMQLEHTEAMTPEQALPIEGIPDGNAEYWGMQDTPNVYGQMAQESFEVGPALTSLLVSKCHEALRTEIPDVLLAAMIYSFGQTFTDRPVPPVFAEGHGREVWDPSIDLSNVVGWFTTIYPVFAGEASAQLSLSDTVKLVKDARRKVPDKGRPYFASRWLTGPGREAFARHWPLEMTFNYLGQYQQLEREGALFTPVGDIAGEVKGAVVGADVGPDTTCISLFEVSAVILKGALRFSFVFNQNMKHQAAIRQWIACCERSLSLMVEELSGMTPEPTLSDFPLLSLTYDRLRVMVAEKLPQAGVASPMELVEDAYPCSPMQSGLLVSTARNRAFYAAYTLHEVRSHSGLAVDTERLAAAWRRMVDFHPMLRTIFIESVSQHDSLYDQVVLKRAQHIPLAMLERETDDDAKAALSTSPLHAEDNANLLHHFAICTSKSSGKVFCRLDISHVIMDGTSLSILFRDLSLAYEGLLKSGEGPLYRNYIKHLGEQPMQPGIEYWTSYLSGVEPCHFPVLDDAVTAETKELRDVRVNFAELAELQRLCDERGVTIVNAIYAAWATTLRFYTASEEVCFGYLTSARDAPIEGVRDVIGPVINMVACRLSVTDKTTLGDMMATVQKDYLDSLAFRHVPIAEVQHALQLSNTALFNTALSYRKLPPADHNPPDVWFDECRPTYDPDEYNVSINIEAGDKDMAVDLMYWTDTLSDAQAANVAGTFKQALSNILHHCEKPIAALNHVSEGNRAQLMQWNGVMPDAIERCIHDLIKDQAALRPDAPAIASWDMDFTYRELDEASTRLAHHIKGLGVGLETFVLVCFEKSAFTLVSMIAILKAGGACVPLDPTHPDAALELRADDTRAPIALVSPHLVDRFSRLVKQTVPVDAALLEQIPIPEGSVLPEVTPRNACFVIYTSGSTGRPKGVVLEHRGLATNAEYSGRVQNYNENARTLQFASYTFDNSLAEIYSTLTRGGCVCVPSEHERLNDLTGAINRLQCNLADITPTVATFLQPSEVPTMKYLGLGGEAVTVKCVEIWKDHVSLTCCYGPSECSVNSTFSPDISSPGKATNIGKAIGSVSWVVDPNDHNCLLPIGCTGELIIDGPIVSRGYLNLPEKTKQSFISPPPWMDGLVRPEGREPGRHLYKTGDLVRYDSDGSLMYLGRKDTQVKLNGQRIELGEIEHHIEVNLPEGAASAVELVVSAGKKSLACFICDDTAVDGAVPGSNDESNILPMNDSFKARAKQLEVALSTKIPAYMIPTIWFPVSFMPLTSSGKLNRRGLRLQGGAVPPTELVTYKLATQSGRAPESETEKTLADMWASILGIDASTIGVEDNFFKLGGDSVSAMKLVTLARTADMNLTVTNIFQRASLLDMAMEASPMSGVPIEAVEPFLLVSAPESLGSLKEELASCAGTEIELIQDVYPCTTLQEGLMALSNREPGAYVAQLVYRLPDNTDTARLKKAWELVVAAESTLRTRIIHTESHGFLQVVVDEAIEWSVVSSLNAVPETSRHLPSSNGGKLTGYTIVGDESTATHFVWTVHHALYDGWCLPIILDKVKECYEKPPADTTLASGPSYNGFIKYLGGLDAKQTDAFWQSRLAGVSTTHFPRLPSPDYQANASSMLIHKTPLTRLPGSEMTVATRIRTAWALTIAAYAGTNDVVFWETLTGRDAPVPGIENMIGATLATVPTRVRLDDASVRVADLLATVQAQSAEAMAHQYAGIQRIRKLSNDAAVACGAQNLIAVNSGSRDEEADSFWNEQKDEMAGTNFYTYPLMLSCHADDQELETVVHYDDKVISEWQMRRVMDHFASVLAAISTAESGNEKLSDFGALSTSDRETLLGWNGVSPPVVDQQVHEMVSEHVARQPTDKLAVVSWDAQLTYTELDSLATRLASVLVKDHGIGADKIVPICFDKSSLVVVAMLATLKAGAAFVPLDPAHPDARIKGILADVEATVILCSPKHVDRCSIFDMKTIGVSQSFLESIPACEPVVATSTPSSAAYIIFTSGTTGKPKGTIVEHAAFCTNAVAHGTCMGIDESSRVLQFASYTFDASIMEILTTLIKGGTVCIPSDEERIHDLAGAINRMGVTWTLLTPSVAQLIQPEQVPSLKVLVNGGEAMSSAHKTTWAASHVCMMNAYGPSETAVTATIIPEVTVDSSAADIGWAIGCLCWVTDAHDHDSLVPIGATGELVVEGPILARGYLKNPEKTAESFIVDPKWTAQFPLAGASGPRRMYKTGDLVRLTEEGHFIFQGRKDNQVKINGQRLELSEVDHNLSVDEAVQLAMATVPSSGPCKKRLIAVLSLKDQVAAETETQTGNLRLVGKAVAASQLPGIRDRVAKHLASYMIPSTWIVLERLPLQPSGKLDRRLVQTWVEEMNEETYQSVLDIDESASALNRDASDLETRIRAAWAKVLNIRVEKVPFTKSFLQLGGDSISAMQLMSVCRSSDIAITVPQIMQSKSIVELAARATTARKTAEYEREEEDKAFDLSPIQKLYFEALNSGSTHFNQSALLGTSRAVSTEELSGALEKIIDTHSMLRARFSSVDGVWTQRITSDVKGSYRLRAHTAVQQDQLSSLIGESQQCLDIVNGPLFAADIFEMQETGQQVVVFVAHHLIIDVVSWHIILQDLEQLMASPTSSLARPLPFQTWSAMQKEQAQNTTLDHVFHDLEIPAPDLAYWGMRGIPNITGDAITESLTLDAEHSRLLLGPAHEALQTDVVDIVLASLLNAFRLAFADRFVGPSILNEGHGREPWDESIDLSRTLGWFTTLFPVFLPESLAAEADLIDIITWVKDFRRKVPGKGRPFFAHQLLAQKDGKQATSLCPAEIAFNFLGQTQQVEGDNSVFKTLDGSMMDSVNALTDIGYNVPRLSLIEITASVIDGCLSMSFSLNRHMRHLKHIREWMGLSRDNIYQAVEKLSSSSPKPTMADFPLLPLSFNGVAQIQEKLPQLGVDSLDDIEAAYPCSPVQQGILFTQIKNPDCYAYSITFEVNSTVEGAAVNAQHLVEAWQAVVQRHSTLRTVFVGSLLQDGTMDQVVLKKYKAKTICYECDEDEVSEKLSVESSMGLPENQPPHRLRVCSTTAGRVVCVLEMSHAISDGTSMPILFQDLALAYEASSPAPRISAYGDYIAFLKTGLTPATMDYWKQYLAGVEPCYFPVLNDGVNQPKVLRTVDQEISSAAQLQTFCTERGVTLSNVFQLAWALVLQAYTGLDDVCFGYLVAGRDLPVRNIDKAIGVFINMLICRVRLDAATNLGEVLRTVQAELVEGMQHKQVSLADIQHETGTSSAPLFNTAYSFQRRSVSKSMAAGPLSFDVSHAQDPSEYDLTVGVEVWDSSAELQLNYWTDRVSDTQAKNIASTFDRVLTSLVTSKEDTPVGEIDILSAHCEQQLTSWNQEEPEARDQCVHEVFENNTKQSSDDTPAIDAWDGRFTYNQLDQMADRFARHLVSLGVKPETYVPLCFEKSAWTVVAMMAVLKAGGAFVPLDPTHPPERISFLVQNVDAKLILCSPSLTKKFESSGVQTFAVGPDSAAMLESNATEPLRVDVGPKNPAYIIFTSGTTGLPKGTIIEHGAFSTGGIAHAKAIKMTSKSRVLQFASHTFDASIMEILSTLLVGGCVCIPSDQDRLNDLAAVIRRFNVTWTLLTPSVANVLKPGSVPSLDVLVTGGEAMSRDHITKWANEACLVNAYGPSETSVIAATSTKVDEQGQVVNREPACIGHAVGSRCWVVDPRNHNRLMPIGGIGELVVEGPIVARGYLNNEAKTRQAFIEHPTWRARMTLAGQRTDRMYKTGDLVASNSDGSFNYMGRKDTQIKLNGQRIELGEIEHHVQVNLPADAQSAVDLVVPQSKASTKALAAFFTVSINEAELASTKGSDAASEIDAILLPMSKATSHMAESLKQALENSLPAYMLPTIYIPVTRMPWTLSGKLDRQRLRAIVQRIPLQQVGAYKLAGASSGQKRKPTTPMEIRLHKVWQKVLNLDAKAISKDDSFFRLGGDSVGAMKLVAAARTERIALTVLDVFKHPKLSDMALACGQQLGSLGASSVKAMSLLRDVSSPALLLDELAEKCGVQKSQVRDAYPCSALQEGLVTMSLQQPGAYVAENVFELPEGIDIDRFKMAWQRTVDQVDILRSRIVNSKSLRFFQVVLQPQPIAWKIVKSLDAATGQTTSVPGRNGGALAQYTLVGDRYFVWTVHHALYDAWSMPNLLGLVERCFHEDASSSSIPNVPFSHFAKYLADVDVQASNNFWKARFQGSSPSHFPAVLSASANAADSSLSLKHAVPYSRASLGIDITIPTIVRAAWALVVGSQTGSDDVVFGETLSGRDISLQGVADILGPTLTTVPVRVEIDRGMAVQDFLKTLHEQAAEVIPYQHAGLQNIKRLGKTMAVACDFNNLLVIQSGEDETSGSDGLMQPVESELGQKNFFTYPLVVECAIEAENLLLTVHHHATVISSWQVERIVHQFSSLVQQLIQTSQAASHQVGELGLCSPEDIEIISDWNETPFQRVDRSITDMFMQVAAHNPYAAAVHAWDGELSYDGVRKHASRLALYLGSKGVQRETLVPCCMDKSLWTTVSMMAVLIAGGTLVPLDPAHPPARHADIVRDCQAPLVLCSPSYQDRFSDLVENIVLVDSSLFTVTLVQQQSSEQESLPIVSSRDAAFVIYTSGSTGKPKGVVIEHHSFNTSARAFMERMQLVPSSRVFHFTSYAFDIAMGETFGALSSGACVCVPSEEMRTGNLAKAINTLGATWAFLTPSVANILDPLSFRSLKTLVCGGEALTPETVNRWADKIVLMNGYGPAECTVFCVSNDMVSVQKDNTNIGRAMSGGHTWVVDPRNHDHLVPLGCVGELLIDGPIVSRGYLNNEKRTAESFISSPAWARHFKVQDEPIRLYKTGDLVKYNPDGSLTFMGRKDHQVKLHGQRMELGEIEANLELDRRIRHALVNLPKAGICKNRLVAIVSLHAFKPADAASVAIKCTPLPEAQKEAAQTQIAAIQEKLAETLPPYMVPTSWLVVEAIPLLVSGKLDRNSVSSWVASMDLDTYKRAVSADANSSDVAEPETATGLLLREIWSSILNIPEETTPVNQTFISMGGDSITAMQVMTRCRDSSIRLTLQEIIKSKSINDLARLIDTENRRTELEMAEYEEKIEEPFALSPVQRLFFNNSADKERGDHFNQSQLLLIKNKVEARDVELAIDALVKRHSMLRSRFQKSANGEWEQIIRSDAESYSSFRFDSHKVTAESAMTPIIATSQKSIDILSGPLFIVDLFELATGSQVISLIAHHLVIDVVSWINIIQDLETYLTTSSLKPQKPLSFQNWCAAQAQQASALELSQVNVLPFQMEPANFTFWGMSDTPNMYGDVTRQSFTISEADAVSLALGECHEALKTEPLDLFISTLLQSFGLTFGERSLPTLFNEGHGREPWDHSIDISQTVGWFTALCPINISLDNAQDSIDSVRKVKDVRRAIDGNGRPYFAYRYLTETGRRELGHHENVEILVNYLGRTQQSSKSASLLEQFDYAKTEDEANVISDVGAETNRMALFEVSISITQEESIEFSFMYNKKMLHQDRISSWIANCKEVLIDTARKLSKAAATLTLSDLPLLPINYSELHKLVNRSLPALQLSSLDEVQDIYPCSPMQTGMLLSQLQDPKRYLFHTVLEVLTVGNTAKIDAAKLAKACSQVVNRHAALRTVFINSVYRGGTFDQVVLKPRDDANVNNSNNNTRVSLIRCREIDIMAKLNAVSLEKTNAKPGPTLPYQFTICQTPQGKVFIKLEMNHAVTDGASTSLVLQDVAKAYANSLTSSEAPSYREYIKYISNQPMEVSLGFWTTYLDGAQATDFPAINREFSTERTLESITLDFDRFSELHNLCASIGATFSSIVMTAWALVLRRYTNLDDVCFGYLVSGRDADIPNINDIVGPFINMLVFRLQFSPNMPVKGLFLEAQEDYLASLPHQHISLARVNHALGRMNRGFFNTAVSIQSGGAAEEPAPGTITYDSVDAHDPSEYAVTLNVNTTRDDEGVLFRYWSNILSFEQAEDLSKAFSELLADFIDHSEQEVSNLRLFQSPNRIASGTPDSPDTIALDPLDLPEITKNTKETLQSLVQEVFPSGSSPSVTRQEDDSLKLTASKKLNDLARLRDVLADKLRSLWRDTLDLGGCVLSDEDSFFELGGDSIIAMSMVGNAREEDLPLTVADVFQNPHFGDMLHCLLIKSAEDYEGNSSDDETVYSKRESGLAGEELYEPFSLLYRKDAEQFVRDQICPVVRVSRASIADVLPTTDFQALSIAGSMLESRWMLNHFYLDGSGPLDIGLLRESIGNVVATFDILRTVFVQDENRYLQVVLRQLQPDIRVHEDVESIEDFTLELEKNHRAETPRLGESTLRFIVARQGGSQRHRIFLRISHAQYDGVCFPAILQALKACYEGEPIMPSPSFAKFVRGALGKVTPQHYAYWRELLRGSAMTEVVPRSRAALETTPTAVLKRVVPTRSLASLNITTATVVKAAWSVVLAQITGNSDIVFGHIISGRNVSRVPGIEGIVGPCLNMVPVRVRHQLSWTVLQLLRHVQDQQVDNMAYESLGFREIMSECTDWDEAQHHHNFTTVVQHQSMPQTGSLSIGGNEYNVGVVASQEDTADFSVVTTPVDASNTEVCLIYASDGAITTSFAEQTFDSLCKAVTAFTEDPEAILFPDAGAASALLLSSATAALAESSDQVVNADLVMAAGTSVEQTTMLGPVS
jgi:amino acid adenylation domain-containing protein/non-ribosomal peptide synthase protein (TIGR01720 family)